MEFQMLTVSEAGVCASGGYQLVVSDQALIDHGIHYL